MWIYDGSARRRHWPDCRNVRDLGGLPTGDGGRIRANALIRSDSLDRLTPSGVKALHNAGVRRILDLRSAPEAAARPTPFADDPIYRLVPLIDPRREPERDPEAERTLAATYRGSVLRNARQIVAGIATIADAPAGAVLVHCAAGKDRTGMVVALVLSVAGIPAEVIAEDYAYTAECLRDQYRVALAALSDESARAALRDQQSSLPQTILAMLDHVTDRYGDVATYLLSNGLTAATLRRLRDRLRA